MNPERPEVLREKNQVEKLIEVYLLVRKHGKIVSEFEQAEAGPQTMWGYGSLRAWRDNVTCGVFSVPDEAHDSHLIFRLDHVCGWRTADELFGAVHAQLLAEKARAPVAE